MLRILIPSVIFVALGSCGNPFQSKVEDTVAQRLKDPESAQFRDVDLYPKAELACGEVNGKNSYGAKSGYSGFVYDDGSVSFEGDYSYLPAFERCTEEIRKHTVEIMKSLPKERREKLEREFERDDLNK